MDATDWEPLKRLFERASALPAEEQAAFLEDACSDDPSRQAQLASLLAAAQEADPFFDSLADAVLSLSPWDHDEPSPPTPAPDPLIGTSIRQYRIEEELARGGMGVVYRAHDASLNRTVALKFLPRRMTGDKAATERFRFEAQAAAALDHPNVCTVYEIGEDEQGRLFIAMAHYEGETLQQKLERGALPIDEALDYARQIAAGLEAAHAQEIVHRDIKPGNVIVTPDGVAKILDFGLAKLTDVALTGTGMTLGTVAYMSPEQVRGATVDHRTDLWSLGVVLYEMLTGERPFKGERSAVVIHAIVHEQQKPLRALCSEAPPAWESAVTRLLSKEPADRYSDVRDFARVLDELARPAPAHGPLARVGTAVPLVLGLYAAVTWIVLQVTDRLIGRYLLPTWVSRGALLLLLIGLPVMLAATLVQTGWQGRPHSSLRKVRRFLTWRRALQGGVAAFALLGGVTGTYSLSRALGIGPAATLVSRGVLEERALLVLSDFESADPDMARLATEAFRIDLSQSRLVRLAQRRFVGEALGRMGREPDAPLSLTLAQEVAQREGAAAVVGGEIHEAGGQYLVAVQLFTPGGLEALVSGRETARDSTEIIATIDKVSALLRERIGESTRTLRAEPRLARVTTSSLAALRKYSQSSEAWRARDLERALPLLEEAVALDSTFAMAWRLISLRLDNLGRDPSRRRYAITKAFEYRDRLPEYERYSLMATYYRLVTHEPAKVIAAWEGRLSLNPDDRGALNNLAEMALLTRDYERAETYYRRWLETQTRPVAYANLAWALADQGKFEEARRTMAPGDPDDPLTRRFTGIIESAAGDYAAARAHFEAVRNELAGVSPAQRAYATRDLAGLSAVTGKLTEAAAYQREAINGLEELGFARDVLRDASRLAYQYILVMEDPASGLRTLEAALERHPLSALAPLDRPYLDVVAVYALAGRPDRARALMGDFENEVEAPDRQTWEEGDSGLLRVHGLIAVAEGRYEDAIDLFRRSGKRGCLLCGMPELAASFDRIGQPDSAIAVYERYLSTPSSGRVQSTYPAPGGDRYYLAAVLERLGQLYDERGDLENAARHYGRFAELWAEADDALQPRVRAVQRRLEEIVAERG
jgi:tetratricopeptide (TPR) repeat protein